jgi:hypothetical protein
MQRRSVRQGALDGVAVRLEAVRLQDAAQRRWWLHVPEVGVHLRGVLNTTRREMSFTLESRSRSRESPQFR